MERIYGTAIPGSFDVSDVVERLYAEAAVSDAVSELRVCYRVQVSRSHFMNQSHTHTTHKAGYRLVTTVGDH